MNPDIFGPSPHVWKILAQAGIVLFILVLSDAMYRYVEKPCRDQAKRYLKRRFPGRARAASTRGSARASPCGTE
ncbi:hypothetical protein D3C76_1805940 [compost metagenome]